MRNPFLVLVLGIGVVDSECRNEEYFQIVCIGLVLNFQNRLLAVEGDPSASFSVAAFASGQSQSSMGFCSFSSPRSLATISLACSTLTIAPLPS